MNHAVLGLEPQGFGDNLSRGPNRAVGVLHVIAEMIVFGLCHHVGGKHQAEDDYDKILHDDLLVGSFQQRAI